MLESIQKENGFTIRDNSDLAGYGAGDWIEVCESRPLDVAILVDSSKSISSEDYEVEKSCIKKLVAELYPINKANTQIAVVQYGSLIEVIHTFKETQRQDF